MSQMDSAIDILKQTKIQAKHGRGIKNLLLQKYVSDAMYPVSNLQ